MPHSRLVGTGVCCRPCADGSCLAMCGCVHRMNQCVYMHQLECCTLWVCTLALTLCYGHPYQTSGAAYVSVCILIQFSSGVLAVVQLQAYWPMDRRNAGCCMQNVLAGAARLPYQVLMHVAGAAAGQTCQLLLATHMLWWWVATSAGPPASAYCLSGTICV